MINVNEGLAQLGILHVPGVLEYVTAALREAEARGMKKAARVCEELIEGGTVNTWTATRCRDAILEQSEKENAAK